MRGMKFAIPAVSAALLFSVPAESQAPSPSSYLSYADLADLSLSAPVAAHVRVTKAVRLKGKDAAAVPTGNSRFYVEADVISLIKGPQGVPSRISYLAELPNDASGRAPKLARKSEQLLFAAPVPGRPGELKLVAPDAQLAWNPAQAERVRQILTEATRTDAPPRISGIGKAFHVPGSLPGESETQIFLQAADGRPISLNVLRRPGEIPRWAVALAEIVDEAAEPPARDTLLWYRLACTLPRALPPQSFTEVEPQQASAIQADYRLVIEGLGACTRSRARS
ncbi:MAG TPA: hypothetical protein VNT77_10230 [Allosphingosinicella sp.]|nr:hypothetical protein [Allosphingosinicella sp.]